LSNDDDIKKRSILLLAFFFAIKHEKIDSKIPVNPVLEKVDLEMPVVYNHSEIKKKTITFEMTVNYEMDYDDFVKTYKDDIDNLKTDDKVSAKQKTIMLWNDICDSHKDEYVIVETSNVNELDSNLCVDYMKTFIQEAHDELFICEECKKCAVKTFGVENTRYCDEHKPVEEKKPEEVKPVKSKNCSDELDVNDTWKNYYHKVSDDESCEFKVDNIWFSREKVYDSLNGENQQEFKKFFMDIDIEKYCVNTLGNEPGKSEISHIQTFIDYQEEIAKSKNIEMDFWWENVKVDDIFQQQVGFMDNYALEWDNYHGEWVKATRNDDDEYNHYETIIFNVIIKF